jgi:hypothetical protein
MTESRGYDSPPEITIASGRDYHAILHTEKVYTDKALSRTGPGDGEQLRLPRA